MREPWNMRNEPRELNEMQQIIRGLGLGSSLTKRLRDEICSSTFYPSQLGAGLSKKEQYRHIAGIVLFYLRKDIDFFTAQDLNEVLTKGNLKPEDIESSRKELESFQKALGSSR